jgi:hypothetical protein
VYRAPVGDEPTIEQAADRALLIELTCQVIAARMEQPHQIVLGTARASAAREDRPVDDVLRDWFRALVL